MLATINTKKQSGIKQGKIKKILNTSMSTWKLLYVIFVFNFIRRPYKYESLFYLTKRHTKIIIINVTVSITLLSRGIVHAGAKFVFFTI